MNNIIFNIKNLKCGYKKSKRPVLEIDELEIEKGKITFFIGSSGVGKSTILESLGLMNKTIQQNEKTTLEFYSNNSTKCYFDLWKKNEKILSNFRKKHFNFIFQSNNLFNSLDAYQNIMIPALLAGEKEDEIKNKTIDILKNILPDLEIKKDKKINVVKLSGGQRQRLAFARAIVSKFDVLFADEPTGNLDHHNAHNIMNYLCEKEKDSTVIVVSHDTELAVSKGDRIIFIDKMIDLKFNPKISWGKISKNSIYKKENNSWKNPQNELISDDELIKDLRLKLKN